ncbi:MAG: hypothetical protein HC830_12315 [Bacteroidetes bacterium]|nr:hypothetical protein [Bacteroidales bacterium]NJO69948.1 hypothetical protein [Bacteroidota bacterium]
MEKEHPILTELIDNSSFSEEFKLKCKTNNFKTLAEIMQHDPDKLLNVYGFNMHHLSELIDMLDQYQLSNLIKE